MNVSDIKALVFGASGGLGSAVCAELITGGAAVYGVSKSADKLSELGLNGFGVYDLRDSAEVTEAFSEAKQSLGGINLVVNAVGVVAFGSVVELSDDVMEELFMVNSFLPVAVAKQAVLQLESGATLVNISGIIAEQNFAGMATYGASKAASRSLWEGFANEAKRSGLKVLDARPPHTETGLASRALAGSAPKLPLGLAPQTVAERIVQAVIDNETDLPSSAFSIT